METRDWDENFWFSHVLGTSTARGKTVTAPAPGEGHYCHSCGKYSFLDAAFMCSPCRGEWNERRAALA